MPLTIESCVAHHTGDREEQQDRAGVFAHPTRAGTMLAALADGMGGRSGGSFAAEQLVRKAEQSFKGYSPDQQSAECLLEGIVSDAHLVMKLSRATCDSDPHSTAAVLVLQPNKVAWIHCGDSRIYHFREERLVARSQDHSLVGELQRKGQLDETGARKHPRRNVLLSCLGSEEPPRTALGMAAPLMAGDSFLLCSDGLWNHFSDRELGLAVSAFPAREAAQVLISHARERAAGGGDNISLVIIKLVEAVVKSSRTTPLDLPSFTGDYPVPALVGAEAPAIR